MAFAGLRGTGDFAVDERPKDFREMILWANPAGQTPLTALMSKMKKQKTTDPEFSWWEEELNAVRVQVPGGATNAATTLTTSAGALNLVPGDVLLVSKTEVAAYDNELVEVSAVNSDTEIVVIRGAAGTTAAAIGANAYLTKIGNAFPEGASSPGAANTNPNKRYNYTQIFKTAYELTGTTTATKARTGDPLKNDKKRKMFQHAAAQEFAYLLGKKFETTDPTTGKPKRYTGGLREFLTTNATVFSATPTEDTFLDAVYPVFDVDAGNAGDQRLVVAGNGFMNSLNKLAKNSSSTRINFDGVMDVYGMKLQSWILPQGQLGFRTHPLMNTHPVLNYSAFIIDASGIVYRPLRDTIPQDNIQAPDADTRKGQWLTEAGIEVRHERTMGYIGNFVV